MTSKTGLGHKQNLALGDQGRVSHVNTRNIQRLGSFIFTVLGNTPLDQFLAGLLLSGHGHLSYYIFNSR